MTWLADYGAYVSGDNTSPLFKRWAGAFIVGAAIQRKCWIKSLGRVIYPNLYILLVGPSAAGKGVALGPIRSLLSELDHQHIAPASLTSAALADELEDASVTFIGPQAQPFNYNALTVISREFGVFLPAYDPVFMNVLTDVWDNEGYEERRRTRNKKIHMPKAMLNIIGGTTPAWLVNTLPDNAWEEGFMSRMIVVYAGAMPPVAITEELEERIAPAACAAGLRRIAERCGQVRFSAEALRYLNEWLLSGGQPAPTHPKLATYNQRRHYNLMKLALIHAVAAGHREIEKEDMSLALDMLLETESFMPDAFKAMRSGGDQQAMRELWDFMYVLYGKNQKPIHRSKLFQFLTDKVPAHNVERVILIMEQAQLIKAAPGGCFIPVRPEV